MNDEQSAWLPFGVGKPTEKQTTSLHVGRTDTGGLVE